MSSRGFLRRFGENLQLGHVVQQVSEENPHEDMTAMAEGNGANRISGASQYERQLTRSHSQNDPLTKNSLVLS